MALRKTRKLPRSCRVSLDCTVTPRHGAELDKSFFAVSAGLAKFRLE